MSTNFTTSFTITQPFLGAPLLFTPALGSQELEQLVDAYVPGTASRQDKMSEVTLDFYNKATVDLNTGALVRTYNVFPSFEQSPTESQSSGFSPAMYTPSPASSSNNFADSGYGSISMTPPARNRGGRVSKSAKKDTKKVAEIRLPGFSIMTKDGIDVTSSAGRGTKTKEQREHAHLMRIMKACDACKRKKIRCDPSHRRQSNATSTTSSSSTANAPSSSSSSSRVKPSPSFSVPSLSQESTFASQGTTPSFDPSNAMDDFVLFPEDGSSAWNPADMSFGDENTDLSQFNFDINDMNFDMPMDSADLDFSSFDNMQPVDFSQIPHEPSMAQNSMDSWAGIPDSHSRPQPSAHTLNSGQMDMDLADSWIQARPDATRMGRPAQSTPSSAENSLYSTANGTPQSVGSLADEIWPDGSGDSIPSSQLSSRHQQPLSERSPADARGSKQSSHPQEPRPEPSPMSGSPLPLSSPIQPSVSHSSSMDPRNDTLLQQSPSDFSSTDASPQSYDEWSASSSLASSRPSPYTDDSQFWTESTDKTRRGRESTTVSLLPRHAESSSSSSGTEGISSTIVQDSQASQSSIDRPLAGGNRLQVSRGGTAGHAQSSRSSLGVSNDIFGLANTCTLVSESLRSVKDGPAECLSLAGDLQRLRTVLVQYTLETGSAELHSQPGTTDAARDTASQIHAFGQRLQGLSARIYQTQTQGTPLPENYLRQCQTQLRLLLCSLCNTINSLQTSSTGTGRPDEKPAGHNYEPLTSGRNLQLFVPATEGHDHHRITEALALPGAASVYDGHSMVQDSRSTLAQGESYAIRLQDDERRNALAFYKDVYGGAFAPGVDSGVAISANQLSPEYVVLAKPDLSAVEANAARHHNSSLRSTPWSWEDSQMVQADNDRIDRADGSEMESSQQQATRVDWTQLSAADLVREELPTAIPSLHSAGGPRYVTDPQGLDTSSRGSIPRATVDVETNTQVVDLVTTRDSKLDTFLQYSKVVLFAALATALLASIARSSRNLSSMLPLFILLSGLSIATPQRFVSATATISFAAMSLMMSGPGLNAMKVFQENCQQWTSGTSLSSIARLSLCAVLVANATSLQTGTKALATMFALLQSSDECCGAQPAQPENLILSNTAPSQRNSSSRRPQWLGMMNHLTTVGA